MTAPFVVEDIALLPFRTAAAKICSSRDQASYDAHRTDCGNSPLDELRSRQSGEVVSVGAAGTWFELSNSPVGLIICVCACQRDPVEVVRGGRDRLASAIP